MGYVMDMRKLIGHRPLILVGCSVIVENQAGEILLGRRTDNHSWTYAGGCLEPGETTEAAARREMREEFGLEAEALELFGVFSGEETHYVYPNGDDAYIVDVVYRCRHYHGEIRRQEEEMEELRFFSPRELPEAISPPAIPVLRDYLRKLRENSR